MTGEQLLAQYARPHTWDEMMGPDAIRGALPFPAECYWPIICISITTERSSGWGIVHEPGYHIHCLQRRCRH